MSSSKRNPEPSQAELLTAFQDVGNTVRWKVRKKGVRIGHEVSCRDGRGYLTVTVNGRGINVHRVLWIMRNGPIPQGMQVDHIDGDQLNNLPKNLRLVTSAGNNRNRRRQRNNTSGVKGVTWNKACGKWQAQIEVDLKAYYIGLFDDLDDARAAIVAAREVLHGEHANHAFLQGSGGDRP